MKIAKTWPKIIQGGMGVGVSDWCLARAVSLKGHLGVVSGTGLDTVVARRLQLGDPGGAVRRALKKFPWPDVARRIREKFFIPGGKPADKPFKLLAMPTLSMSRTRLEMLMVANFVEVFLAREGHNGPVGINYLEKVQLPALASLFGAMLAGVSYVLMGGGIPLSIPGVLDQLARMERVELRINVEDNALKKDYLMSFDPRDYGNPEDMRLVRPDFLAIVSSSTLARTMVRRASGRVDGFIVEDHTAGGHNAPPRRKKGNRGPGAFGDQDIPDIAQISSLGLPFWLAGSCSSPKKMKQAVAAGAQGIQAGSIFAFCRESGFLPEIKQKVMEMYKCRSLRTATDFSASPTGYPFKLLNVTPSASCTENGGGRKKICDLGYLRQVYSLNGRGVGYRCPAEDPRAFISKGGSREQIQGRHCLCNGLMAAIGLGQMRNGKTELPLITSGEDFSFFDNLLTDGAVDYSAADVISYLLA